MAHLGIFAKYWQAGRVKTRLAAGLGNQPAAELYLIFLEHLTNSLMDCCDRRTLVYSPDQHRDAFVKQFGDAWNYVAQVEGGLGTRLSQFFSCPKNTPADGKLIVIGSDTPNLRPDMILQASKRLDHSPVVLGPSKDGGYYLIGRNTHLSANEVDLFDKIPWSTQGVLKETVRRLETAQVPYHQLPTMCDVDDLTDLRDLMRALKATRNPTDLRLMERIQIYLPDPSFLEVSE